MSIVNSCMALGIVTNFLFHTTGCRFTCINITKKALRYEGCCPFDDIKGVLYLAVFHVIDINDIQFM